MRESFQDNSGTEWVHPEGAAIMLGICVRTLRYWRRTRMVDGRPAGPIIPFIRHHTGTCRYRVTDIRAYISAQHPPIRFRGDKTA